MLKHTVTIGRKEHPAHSPWPEDATDELFFKRNPLGSKEVSVSIWVQIKVGE
jgi:hypothetical protein